MLQLLVPPTRTDNRGIADLHAAAATFNMRAHDGSTPSATVAGCTDGAQGDCQTYWRAYKVAARGDEVCSAT